MKYRLKDRELQKKLDELSRGTEIDFSHALSVAAQFAEKDELVFVHFGNRVDSDPGCEHTVIISWAQIMEVEDYDPTKWNKFPAVTPPEGVWMRTEMHCPGDREGLDRKLGAIFLKGQWRNSDGDAYPKGYTVKRFRPWED